MPSMPIMPIMISLTNKSGEKLLHNTAVIFTLYSGDRDSSWRRKSEVVSGADLFFWDEFELNGYSESINDRGFNNDIELNNLSDWLIVNEVNTDSILLLN